jgi:hypothetical protein
MVGEKMHRQGIGGTFLGVPAENASGTIDSMTVISDFCSRGRFCALRAPVPACPRARVQARRDTARCETYYDTITIAYAESVR